MKKVMIVLGWVVAGSIMAQEPTLAPAPASEPEPCVEFSRVDKVRVKAKTLEFNLENGARVFTLPRTSDSCSDEMDKLEQLTDPTFQFCVIADSTNRVTRIRHRQEKSVLVQHGRPQPLKGLFSGMREHFSKGKN